MELLNASDYASAKNNQNSWIKHKYYTHLLKGITEFLRQPEIEGQILAYKGTAKR